MNILEILNFFAESNDRVFGLLFVMAVFFGGISLCLRSWRGKD